MHYNIIIICIISEDEYYTLFNNDELIYTFLKSFKDLNLLFLNLNHNYGGFFLKNDIM